MAAPSGNEPGDVEELPWHIQWGRLLRAARQVAGLSLTELSAMSGLSKGYLSKLESGHPTAQNPSRATLAALARALPSFRPLAHTLEPGGQLEPLAFDVSLPRILPLVISGPRENPERRSQIGWRELEVLVAAVTLERAAPVQPLSAVALARAVGRSVDEVEPIIRHLVEAELLLPRAQVRPGAPAAYICGPDITERAGISRVGDALVLAAAVLGQIAGDDPRTRHKSRP